MKASHVVFQRAAQEDVDVIARYIAGDNPEAARRFLVVLDDLCKLLIHTPDIGSVCIFQNPRLRSMRIMPVRKNDIFEMSFVIQSILVSRDLDFANIILYPKTGARNSGFSLR